MEGVRGWTWRPLSRLAAVRVVASASRDEELLRWAGGIAKARGRVQAAKDVGLNYRTLARALDDRALTCFVREALIEAQRAGFAAEEAEGTEETAEDLARRVEAAEAQLADALVALVQERERAAALERRLALVEEWQAGEPGAEQPAQEPEAERSRVVVSNERSAAGGAVPPSVGLVRRGTHRPGVVTLEPLDGEDDAFGEAGELVAEWRGLRGGQGRRGSAVERARAAARDRAAPPLVPRRPAALAAPHAPARAPRARARRAAQAPPARPDRRAVATMRLTPRAPVWHDRPEASHRWGVAERPRTKPALLL